MTRDINFDEIVKKVQVKHPDFSDYDIIELCESYISSFPKKTKVESVIRSLDKYITKEFGLNDETDDIAENNGNEFDKNYSLDNIPKSFFQQGKINKDIMLLRISGLTKALGKTFLFDDTEIQINGPDKIALIGRNGAGKSTLLKIIIGMEEMDDGLMEKAKGIRIGYLSQDLFWSSRENSLEEEMLTTFAEITKYINRLNEIKSILNSSTDSQHDLSIFEEKQAIEEWLKDNDGFNKYSQQTDILKYFGFTPDQLNLKISQLSGGEQTKVQIAKFFLQDVDLLILDEPTNHLDIEGIMFLEKFCILWQKALICISHDKKFIDNVFDKIIEISDRKLHTYFGNYQDYIEQKQKNYELGMKNFTNQQKELDKQNEFIERFRYKASKAAQVQSRIKMMDKIEILEEPEDEITVKEIKLDLDIRMPNTIMILNKIKVGYTEALITLSKLLEINKDKKIGVVGRNGAGKTTLLKTILGELKPLEGTYSINEKLTIGSYSQVADNLDMEKTIIEELALPGGTQTAARSILGGLLITGEKVNQKIKTLSGGEKAKVALTKMLLEKPHLIIMDEPTNHLDLYSKESIKKMLEQFPGVTLIVSHDRDLLASISNTLWVIKDKKMEIYDDIEKGFERIS